MAQHDQVIDNASGLAVRTDINAALAALFSSNSGTVEPTVKAAGQLWFDTTTAPGTIKIRNSANNAWITLGALSSVGMSSGLRASPDRWVVNDAPDLTGNDLFWVLDTSGNVVMRERLSIIETDGSVRAVFLAGIGADPGSLYCVVYNAAGAEVNRWWLTTSGLFLSQGSLRFNPASGVLRGNIAAELVGAAGRLDLQTYSNAPALDGSAVLSASGLALNVVGDFYISRSGFIRANFGWTASAGAIIQARDSAGGLNGELDVNSAGADLLFGSHRFVASGVVRGTFGAERSVAAGRLDLRSLNNAAVEDGYLTVSPNGGGLSYGDFFIWRGAVMRANFGWDTTLGAYMKSKDAAGASIAEMYLHSNGLMLTAGDFYVYRSGFQRANFGWDSTNGAYMRMKDAAGVLTTELGLSAAIATIRQTGTNFRFRVLSSGAVERGSFGVDIAASSVYMDARDAAGAVAARLDVDATGAKIDYTGVTDAKIFDTGWFPKGVGVGVNELDFPVGTDLFFIASDAQIVNRNAVCVVRAESGGGLRSYTLNVGANIFALSGTWVSCGAQQIGANPWQGIARRIA